MKKYSFVLITVIFVVSCVKEESGDSTYTTINNKSGYDIEIQEFLDGNYRTSTFIDNNQSIELVFGAGDHGGPIGPRIKPLTTSDSVRVIYYEKASIWHTTDENSSVSKSLMLESSYTGGKVRDGLYEYTYTFTPEDFDEAVLYGD